MTALVERLARMIHAIHGTRGLIVAVVALLTLTIVEPAISAPWLRALLAFPIFVVAVVTVATLPREGIAVQLRLRRLVEDKGAGRALARHLVFPAILVFLLLPPVFLAAVGIPHMSLVSGLLLPSMVRRLAAVFLFGLLLLPVLHLRRTIRYAPDQPAMRPRDLRDSDDLHGRRDLLLATTLIVAATWLLMLRPFWAPFSLLDWPPTLASFAAGVRPVAAVAYSVFLPVLLFTHMVAHGYGLRWLLMHAGWSTHRGRFMALVMHLLLAMVAVALHIYNLLWIVRYQAATGF